jgi:rubrerythrin
MTNTEERARRLKSSIKHNRKALERLQYTIERDEVELHQLEKHMWVCPVCLKEQELPIQGAPLVCKYCSAIATRIV